MTVIDEKDQPSGNWPTVRDSWVEEEMPGPSIPLTLPVDTPIAAMERADEPAPEAEAEATAAEAPVEETAAAPSEPPPVIEAPAQKSLPPPLPSGPMLPTGDPARSDLMFERLAANDYEGALLVAQSLIARVPHDEDALECAEMSARELWKLHEQRLGSLDRVPQTLVAPDALPPSLNLRAGFLLARVDGVASVREIVDRAGLPLIDALRGMAELYLVGAIGFGGPLT